MRTNNWKEFQWYHPLETLEEKIKKVSGQRQLLRYGKRNEGSTEMGGKSRADTDSQ
jgi:hypothetical protein